MLKFNKSFPLVYRTILAVAIAGLVWLQGFGTAKAVTMPRMTEGTYLAQTLKDAIKPKPFDEKRSEAIKECLPPELAAADIGERVERAIKEMGNDQIERAFNVTDDPALSEAEAQFESCLQTKGVLPERQAQS